jgi:hypothetical protein
VPTRLNVTFNPHATLRLFAQPLISAGDYLPHKSLAAAEAFHFDVYEEGTAVVSDGEVVCVGVRACIHEGVRHVDFSFGDRDFNIRSLRPNAVLRWEYRPGSTLFLVRQQNRHDRSNVGDFDLRRDLGALVCVVSDNVFILKVDY